MKKSKQKSFNFNFFFKFFFKNPEFWYGRGKILVKKNYTPGKILVKMNYTPGVKKIKKNSKNFNFSLFFCSNFFFKNPEFWYGRTKIRVKKENTLYCNI